MGQVNSRNAVELTVILVRLQRRADETRSFTAELAIAAFVVTATTVVVVVVEVVAAAVLARKAGAALVATGATVVVIVVVRECGLGYATSATACLGTSALGSACAACKEARLAPTSPPEDTQQMNLQLLSSAWKSLVPLQLPPQHDLPRRPQRLRH